MTGEVLLVSVGKRPWLNMLLNNIHGTAPHTCMGQPLTTKSRSAESTVLKLRNHVLTEDEIMKEWILVTELAIKIENNL